MQLSVVAFGKLKTPGLRDSADYYLGLIKTLVPVTELELKPLAVPDKSAASRARIQRSEAELLAEKLDARLGSRGICFLLDERGKSWSTEEWATRVRGWKQEGIPSLAFCVGSSLGFEESLRKRARAVISLGPQTLPHELARVVLYEQLYRAFSYVAGHPYHVAD